MIFEKFFGDRFQIIEALKSLGACLVISILYAKLAPSIIQFFFPTATIYTPDGIEILSTGFNLACVYLTRRENVWCWPFGLIGVAFLGWVFLKVGLISQFGLQWFFYGPVQFWAWWIWAFPRKPGRFMKWFVPDNEVEVSYLRYSHRVQAIIAIVAGTFILGLTMESFYDNPALIYWDASIAAASIVAQILMSFKKAESWWIWSVPVNISAIALTIVAGSYMTAFLYFIFLVNAVYAIYQWNMKANGKFNS